MLTRLIIWIGMRRIDEIEDALLLSLYFIIIIIITKTRNIILNACNKIYAHMGRTPHNITLVR